MRVIGQEEDAEGGPASVGTGSDHVVDGAYFERIRIGAIGSINAPPVHGGAIHFLDAIKRASTQRRTLSSSAGRKIEIVPP